MWRAVIWGVIGCLALCAEDPITLTGVVVDAVTGAPLPRTKVNVNDEFFAATEDDGRFSLEVKEKPTSSVQLTVSHRGYARHVAWEPLVEEGTAGKTTRKLTIKLTPLGVIHGRVVNSDGEPVPGLLVQAHAVLVVDGRRQVQAGSYEVTNDLGEYRIPYMLPGKYYLKVSGPRGATSTFSALPASVVVSESYGPQYFPAATNRQSATLIQLAPAQEFRADMTIDALRSFRIRGRIGNVSADRILDVWLIQGEESERAPALINPVTGVFEVRDVRPGLYVLRAQTNRGAPLMVAETQLVVGDRDVSEVQLGLSAGVTISGEFKSSAFSSRPMIAIEPASTASAVTSRIDASVDSKGRFTLKNVPQGHYRFRVTPWTGYVSAIVSGQIDVLREGITVGQSDITDVEIRASGVGGRVEMVGNAADKNVTVSAVVVRTDRGSPDPTYFNGSGDSLHSPMLAPGTYLVYAWTQPGEVEYRNPEVLRGLAGYVTEVSIVKDGEIVKVPLKLLPEAAAR